MTDRHAGYLVTLEHPTHTDDAKATVHAIEQIKGVVSVTPVVDDVAVQIAKEMVLHDMRVKLLDVLFPKVA